jgi:nuclear receptor co-repressor 1
MVVGLDLTAQYGRLIMSSSGYPPNQGAFSTEQSRYPSHSVQYTFSSTRHQQEFAVPDYCSSRIEVSQASKLLQQQQQEQLLRRPSLLSEFHQGSDRPQERRTEYEQFHTEPSPVDHDSLESERPRLEPISDAHFQRVSAGVLPLVHSLPEGLRSSADAKKDSAFGGKMKFHPLLWLGNHVEMIKMPHLKSFQRKS